MLRALQVIGILLIFCPLVLKGQNDSIPLQDTTHTDTLVIGKDKIAIDALPQIPTEKDKKKGLFSFLNDSTGQHSPKKAMILSAVLPGAGQIYNKKYWKAPVVWAGFGAFAYFINQNNLQYRRFKRAYIYSTDNDTTTISEFPNVSPDLIANERNIYRKWRDLSIILTVGWYALNIVDANVDAHLFAFDIEDDMTLRWEPTFNMAINRRDKPLMGGLRLTLDF